jgi:hypothetical protein
MSFEIVSAAPDLYGKLVKQGNPPLCDIQPFIYTRYFNGDKTKPFCTKTIAGFWDAQKTALEKDLPVMLLSNLSVICLGKGSLVYHGYKGVKNINVDRGTTSGLRHVKDDTSDACENQDTLKCYHEVSFPWIELGFPLEDKPFFCGSKTTADVYGADEQNTFVVAHKVPSGRILGRASYTEDKVIPLYQVPFLGGTTVTFELLRDAKLINIGSVNNAKKFIAWLKKQVREAVDFIFNMYKIVETQQQVKRTSVFEDDYELVRLVRLWLKHEGLESKIDGWFWGGEEWKECSKDGYGMQEFCLFNPMGLLEYKKHTEQVVHAVPDLPDYDEFWKKAFAPLDHFQKVVHFPL